jgi:hypothetical protein
MTESVKTCRCHNVTQFLVVLADRVYRPCTYIFMKNISHNRTLDYKFSTKAFLISHMRATYPTHLTIFDLIILIISIEEHKLWSSSLRNFLHPPVASSHLDPNIFLTIRFSDTFILLSSLMVGDAVPQGCTRARAIRGGAPVLFWVSGRRPGSSFKDGDVKHCRRSLRTRGCEETLNPPPKKRHRLRFSRNLEKLCSKKVKQYTRLPYFPVCNLLGTKNFQRWLSSGL